MASNPRLVSMKEERLTKVATSVKTGMVCKHRIKGRHFQYLMTYRLTGETAPTVDEMLSEGVIMFSNNAEQEKIDSAVNIDVYCYGNYEDSKTEFGMLIVWV